jgi:hypothetical protein
MKLRGENWETTQKRRPRVTFFLPRSTLSRLSCGVLDFFQPFGRSISILP